MADHVSDFTKAPDQIVVDLINHSNPGAALTPALLNFGIPTLATGETPPRNSELELTAAVGSGYKGAVSVQYDRLNLQGFVAAGATLELPIGNATRFSDLIPEINAALGINLTANDYNDGDLPEFEGTPNEVQEATLIVNADSLVYLGSLVINLIAEDIELSAVITNLVLEGLNYPATLYTPD